MAKKIQGWELGGGGGRNKECLRKFISLGSGLGTWWEGEDKECLRKFDLSGLFTVSGSTRPNPPSSLFLNYKIFKKKG